MEPVFAQTVNVSVCARGRTPTPQQFMFQMRGEGRQSGGERKCVSVCRWVRLAGQAKALPASAQHHRGGLRLYGGRSHSGKWTATRLLEGVDMCLMGSIVMVGRYERWTLATGGVGCRIYLRCLCPAGGSWNSASPLQPHAH